MNNENTTEEQLEEIAINSEQHAIKIISDLIYNCPDNVDLSLCIAILSFQSLDSIMNVVGVDAAEALIDALKKHVEEFKTDEDEKDIH